MKLTAKSIRAWRLRNDLTQEECAKLVRVSISTWRSWEYGRRSPNPKGKNAADLRELMGAK